MSCAGFSRLLSTGRGIREPSSTEGKRIWVKGRVVAVLHLRLSAAEWDVWIPRCRGSAVRRAVPPAPSGAGPPEPRALAGREGLQRRTGRGAEVAPQVWGRFREMEVRLCCDSQLLRGPRLFPSLGGVSMTVDGVAFAYSSY